MSMRFLPLEGFHRGCVAALLRKSYASLVETDPLWRDENKKFDLYDEEVFSNPKTVGACIFFTECEGCIVGFGSWDPRGRPNYAIIGHNCVLPEFRRRGYGVSQIQEILRRFKAQGIQLAKVSTCAHDFSLPARRMYEACGFIEIRRVETARGQIVEYEKRLV